MTTLYSEDVTQFSTAFSKMPNEETKLFYGVELEVYPDETIDRWAAARNCERDIGKYVNTRNDLSIPGGFEIVTVPATLKFHRQVIWDNFFNLAGKDLNNNGPTGLHIHFSREAVTNTQLAKAIYFMHETTNSAFLSKIAGRRVADNSTWCKQTKKKYNATEVSENEIIQSESNVRTALCVSKHYRGTTCEMRIFKSAPSKAGVLQALDFVDCLLKYCLDCPNDEKALSGKTFSVWFSDTLQKETYPWLYDNLVRLNIIKEQKIKGWKLLMRKVS
jgi:hypothetical protein